MTKDSEYHHVGSNPALCTKRIIMKVARESIKIDVRPLISLIHNNPSVADKDYELIENQIHSCDEEDGGGWYKVIIKRKLDNKFFSMEYCDWEISNDEISGFLDEVFPKQVTVTIYE